MQPKESKSSWHFVMSILKSCLRIGAGFSLIFNQIFISGILFIFAELLGILEEL